MGGGTPLITSDVPAISRVAIRGARSWARLSMPRHLQSVAACVAVANVCVAATLSANPGNPISLRTFGRIAHATTCRGALEAYVCSQTTTAVAVNSGGGIATIVNFHFAFIRALPRRHRVDHQVGDNLTLAVKSEDVGHARSRDCAAA